MSFFAVLLALVIEQFKPLPRKNRVLEALQSWIAWSARNFDAGQSRHAWVVWGVTVVVPALVVTGVYELLRHHSFLLGLAFDVGVVYLTLGFRQFSHYFTDIRDALERSDDTEARRLLAEWRHLDASELPRTELLRHVIEHSLLAAHRHVFGVVVWFSVLAALGLGPIGAVIYRLGMELPRWWAGVGQPQDTNSSPDGHLSEWALWAWKRIDWLPARMTAVTFAIVGNFEEAIDCWRNHAQSFPDDNDGVVLAATSGAINVRLGGETLKPRFSTELDTPMAQPSTPGLEPHLGHLRSMVGLVWRSVVMWLVLLFLLTLARLLG